MGQKGEVGGRLRDPVLYLYVPSQSPTPPQISGRLHSCRGPGTTNGGSTPGPKLQRCHCQLSRMWSPATMTGKVHRPFTPC